MAGGFEGWISVYDQDASGGTGLYYPQILHADSESFSFKKDIRRSNHVSFNKTAGTWTTTPLAAKPQGGVVFQFRSDDCLKILYSHFQLATVLATTAPYRYSFYPLWNSPDYYSLNGYAQGSYGAYACRPYLVTILKKLFDTDGTSDNTFLFSSGFCQKLGISLDVNDDAKMLAEFKFGTYDNGSMLASFYGGSNTGSMSTLPSFAHWSATVLINGSAYDLSSLQWEASQELKEISRVGRLEPQLYKTSDYIVNGRLAFDLPVDALSHVGSMFGTQNFHISATLFNGTSERVCFVMPLCRRKPFEFKSAEGMSPVSGVIPFEAFGGPSTPPITVTVDTDNSFSSLSSFLDALLGVRTVGEHTIYTALLGARTLSEYELINRDL